MVKTKKKIVLQISGSSVSVDAQKHANRTGMPYQNQVKLQTQMRQKLQPLLGARQSKTWPSGVESNVEYTRIPNEFISVVEVRRASSHQLYHMLPSPC